MATPTTESQLRDVTRTVESDGDTHVVSLAQTFPATADDLWGALTTPERLHRWFAPVAGDLREGGRYELSGMGTGGSITTARRNERLSLTWEFGGEASTVDLLITPQEQGARLELRHTVGDDAHWATYGPAATGVGWDGSFLGLALHIDDGTVNWTELMAEYDTTAQGRQFTVDTARAWEEAHVAAGADPQAAHQSGVRTAAFYLGDE